jgi:hypothetical protein
MIRTYFPGDTVKFTLTSSAPPDAAPLFTVTDAGGSLVTSMTAATSDATHYYALHTATTTPGYFIATWQIQKTLTGSVYPFFRKTVFQIKPLLFPP